MMLYYRRHLHKVVDLVAAIQIDTSNAMLCKFQVVT